jgi:hypothetical protein
MIDSLTRKKGPSSIRCLAEARKPGSVFLWSSLSTTITTTRSRSTTLPHHCQGLQPDPTLVDARYAPVGFDPSNAVVYRDFVTSQEAEILVEGVLSRMKR